MNSGTLRSLRLCGLSFLPQGTQRAQRRRKEKKIGLLMWHGITKLISNFYNDH
jgi:hypothetical protein